MESGKTAKSYVEQDSGAYRIAGTRVSLDSIVYAFRHGHSAEDMVQSFPLLTLEQVYGAIAFYLANRETIDAYLEEGETEYDIFRRANRQENRAFYQRLNRDRRQLRAS